MEENNKQIAINNIDEFRDSILMDLDESIDDISSLMDIDFIRYINQVNTEETNEFIRKINENEFLAKQLQEVKEGYAMEDWRLADSIVWEAYRMKSPSFYELVNAYTDRYIEETTPVMTREVFVELFSKEMNSRGYPVSEGSGRQGVSFKNKADNREFILRYEGETDGQEWLVSEVDGNYFEFQVQSYESFDRDYDYDRHCTPMDYNVSIR